MIKIGRNTDLDVNRYEENWMIVRKPEKLLDFVTHEPLLSPSPLLFQNYREAFHKGCFNQAYFDTIYVPQFLTELSENEAALECLSYLTAISREKEIVLACYCENESMCHRSIIAGILLGLGADIETDSAYGRYYDMFVKCCHSESSLVTQKKEGM